MNKSWLGYSLGALFIFTAGFFIVFGKEAAVSGSWKYVMNHSDESRYWVDAKTVAVRNFEEQNPFYYEDAGRARPVPEVAAVLIGQAARLLHVDVLLFFPLWHIGMPFLNWLVLSWCLTYFWKRPRVESAAFSMVILLATLVLRGPAHLILVRFPRPLDALWLAVLWLSWAFHVNWRDKRQFFLFGVVALVTPWVNFYIGCFGIWAVFLETLWQWRIAKDSRCAKALAVISASAVGGALTYIATIIYRAADNRWFHAYPIPMTGERLKFLLTHFGLPAFLLLLFVVALVLGTKRLAKTRWTVLDRLMIFIFSTEIIGVIAEIISPSQNDWVSHQYYILPIQLVCFAGWCHERISDLLRLKGFKRVDLAVAAVIAVAQPFIFSNPQLRYLGDPAGNLSNAALLLLLAPVIYLLVWCAVRFKIPGTVLFGRWLVVAFIVIIAGFGYVFWPSELRHINKQFPFEGAYAWLNAHAPKDSVVLTASAAYSKPVYLQLYTDCYSYYHEIGHVYAISDKDRGFRKDFFYSLMLNLAGKKPLQEFVSIQSKIRRFRFDYLLADAKGPFVPILMSQMAPFLREVYRDENALLWRVEA